MVGLLIYGLFNSQLILGQFEYLINPGAAAEAPAQASGTVAASAESAVVIPKINLNAPVVYDETSYDEKKIQEALQRGVVHYGTTGLPGQLGNNVIVGHSSNNWWAGGKYKFAFVLLSKLEVGDTFYLDYQSQRYTYEVFDKKIIEPTDVSVLTQQLTQPTATLITCDPPGTSWRRMVVQGKQISPDPAKAQATSGAAPESLDSPFRGTDSHFGVGI